MTDHPTPDQRYTVAITALDRAFPDGWRSGDPTTDGLMVVMAAAMQKIGAAMFQGDHR